MASLLTALRATGAGPALDAPAPETAVSGLPAPGIATNGLPVPGTAPSRLPVPGTGTNDLPVPGTGTNGLLVPGTAPSGLPVPGTGTNGFSLASFTPDVHAVGGSLAGTALLGLVPLAVFFVLLMVVRRPALQAALGALVAALLVGIFGMGMPVRLALLSASQGLLTGLLPIMLIVVAALWFYELTVVSGRFEDLRRCFNAVGRGDLRVQAMLIAFCFGGLLEALAGFGAPVAITAAMLMALGLPPLKSAITVLVANTAPVAFGAMAIPVTTAGNLTGIPPEDIASVIGRQSPLLALFVPLLLRTLIDRQARAPSALARRARRRPGLRRCPVLVLGSLRLRAHRRRRLPRRLRGGRAHAALVAAAHAGRPALAGRGGAAARPPRDTGRPPVRPRHRDLRRRQDRRRRLRHARHPERREHQVGVAGAPRRDRHPGMAHRRRARSTRSKCSPTRARC